jgi:flagellar assembly factor FliW
MVNLKTGRFGQISVKEDEVIQFPLGVIGFPKCTRFCLVDSGDDTLILWLQSLDDATLAFPVLEPKIFKPEYIVRLSAAEMRELFLSNLKDTAVFNIITIPADLTQMTANLKAPIVINLKDRIAKQVVLQENDYTLKHPMFKELKSHIMTIQASARAVVEKIEKASPMKVNELPASPALQSLAL